MENREIDAAWRFHDGTKHSYYSVRSSAHYLDWPNQPLPFKIYKTLEPIALPKNLKPSSVPALEAIASVAGGRPGEILPGLESLGRVFYFSAGITRVKNYAGGQILFRSASCTGALYHVELYLACCDLPGLPAGVYHFGPKDFALRRLRAGDWRGTLAEAAGGNRFLASAPAVVIFTSTFWRNSWKYQARAYRHSFWDSGTLLANLFAVAAAEGLSASLLLGFADEPVNQLLDVDTEREVALGLVTLGQSSSPPPSAPRPVEPLNYETERLSYSEVDYPAIREMHSASSLRNGEEATAWGSQAVGISAPEPAGPLFPLTPFAEAEMARDSVEEVILRRGSTRQFARASISFAQLSTLLEPATRGLSADFLQPEGASLNDLYLIVNAVEDLPPGAYFYHRRRGTLEQLKEGDFRREAGYLDLGQELAADASLNVYMLADLKPVLERLGNRGYRAAQLEGAIIGGKLYLGSYAQRLGATGLTFFDDDVIRFFSPHAEGKSVMFLTAIGKPARRQAIEVWR